MGWLHKVCSQIMGGVIEFFKENSDERDLLITALIMHNQHTSVNHQMNTNLYEINCSESQGKIRYHGFAG